jgi:hypothetical protein
MKHNSRDSGDSEPGDAGRRRLLRSAGDFVFALAVFWGLSFATSASHGRLFILLSLIVAGVATFNLAFLRHLRRVYASPRRGVWRRE